jgi:chromosomal replication initiation ATPase DnaA
MLPPSSAAWVIPGMLRFDKKKIKPLDVCRDLLEQTCSLYGLTADSLKEGKKRAKDKVYVKHVFFYFVKEVFDKRITLKELGAVLELKHDHTTVIHAIQHIKDLMDVDEEVPDTVEVQHASRKVRQDYQFTKQRLLQWLRKKQLLSLVSQVE